jgi:RNA polymerase sigma-70 factor (ECF subfamily)
VSAFEITLEGMPDTSAKASDNAVDERCQKLIREGAVHQALELLMEAYGTSVYAFCYSLLHDTNSAADILQTTFVQAFNSLPGFEKRLSFHVWLMTIARNRSVDHLRTLRRRERLSAQVDKTLPEADSHLLADQLIHKQQMLRTLEQCLEELRSQTKDSCTLDALMLRFRDSLSYEQMSKKLGSSPVALRVRVTRVLPKLKHCIESKRGRA